MCNVCIQFIKDAANKLYTMLMAKQSYHAYKYTYTSLHKASSHSLFRYSSPSTLQPCILRPPLIIRPLDLVLKGNLC